MLLIAALDPEEFLQRQHASAFKIRKKLPPLVQLR